MNLIKYLLKHIKKQEIKTCSNCVWSIASDSKLYCNSPYPKVEIEPKGKSLKKHSCWAWRKITNE